MSNVISLSDRRKPTEAPALAPITRTPELAIIMAMFEAMPRKTRAAVFHRVSQFADRCPDCDASQEAARIVSILTVAMGAKP